MQKLGVETVEDMLSVVTTYYPPKRILPKTQYLVEQMVDEMYEQ